MKRQQSSISAEGIAWVRAQEALRPEGARICYDPLANYFVSGWFRLAAGLFIGYARRRSPGVFELLTVRCRYIDDYLLECLHADLHQLVVLGAGFDSRTYRFPQLAQHNVHVFEVDHPATQARKRARLQQVLGTLPDNVTFVPIDFNTQNLEERLLASGYTPTLRTLFIWEGVTEYLTPQAVDATLAFIAQRSEPGSSVIFDYLYAEEIAGKPQRKEVQSMQRWSGVTGEGLTFGIRRGTLEAFLQQRGFCDVVDADRTSLLTRYMVGSNAGRPLAGGYGIVHATVARGD